jgi:4-oxalomesaconate tautomerase
MRLFQRVLGGPDALQIDGVGGGHPLTSKVAVIRPSTDTAADVDYLFLQVDPLRQTVSDAQNCGNILAGVGLFAIDKGMVRVSEPLTTVRVRMLNTQALCDLQIQVKAGRPVVEGDAAIDGVPGTAAPIVCTYQDIAGSTCGSLFPTSRSIDTVDGIDVTCVDNGMPVVVLSAEAVGISGRERPEDLDENVDLKQRLESIRLKIAPRMNLGDVSAKSVPKMCLVSPAQHGGLVMTRTFIPHVCHKTIGVLGAVSVASACLTPGSVAAGFVDIPEGNRQLVSIEHAQGAFDVQITSDENGDITDAGVVRTARILFQGEVMV